MDLETKKIGIIGCSRVFEKYFLPAIKSTDKAKITFIGSREKEKAKKFAKISECNKFGNYEDVINSDVDAIYISLPVGLQEEWIIKAIKNKKHVLCEKSATTSYDSACKIISESKKNRVRILEGFSFRFHPQHRKIQEILKNEEFKKIFNFQGDFGFPNPPNSDIRWNKELGGGILNDAGCYPICASRIIFNEEPVSVFAKINYDISKKIDVGVNAMLMFNNEKIAFISSGYGNYFQSKYKIWGNNARLSVERAYAVLPDKKTTINFETNDTIEKICIKPSDQTCLMIECFCDEISNINSSKFNFEEDLINQSKVLEAIRKSSSMQQHIYLKDF